MNWFPFWTPIDAWWQILWIFLLPLVLVIWLAWVVLDWIAPRGSKRRRFIDRFIVIG
jgi:hypothetical protein